ncbi:MAG: glycosyltransferase family 2 protein [Acidobacteria bacterium]|nr:MAG: glycosyltransferase family 2 protein [Acidobacteriota bacterium]
MKPKVFVLIATSQNRTKWLIERSLVSVYKQEKVDKKNVEVLVVDDNKDEQEFHKIREGIKWLRRELRLAPDDFYTEVLRNARIRFRSGSGAWNTGIYQAYERHPDSFISILDDDDEYLPTHLWACISRAKESTNAVFQRLLWVNDDGSIWYYPLTKEQLTAEEFYIGNPGVQASNMFFKTEALVRIGGFDEELPATTDRDLMIRFLTTYRPETIEVVESYGVKHYNHNQSKVTKDTDNKYRSLLYFYQKYKMKFSRQAFERSLDRAHRLFGYHPKEQILICMLVQNAEKTIEKSIQSFIKQKNVRRELVLLIGNDGSTDGTEHIIRDITKLHDNIFLIDVPPGSIAQKRNFLNKYARESFPHCVLIGRLDADDMIYSEDTLAYIEGIFEKERFDILLAGNKQIKNGKVLSWINRATPKLLEERYLLRRLRGMAQGKPRAELPSCNTFITPWVDLEYPDKNSAEDHWFTVLLILQKHRYKIHVAEELIYCYYSLSGNLTEINKSNQHYINSRQELYHFFLNSLCHGPKMQQHF